MDDSPSIQNNHTHNSLLNLTNPSSSSISLLEQEVLDEYQRLLTNMNTLSSTLAGLTAGPMTPEIADGLRLLERKVASVYTLMKASVYSVVLQRGGGEESGVGGGSEVGG